jgi:hypothetical protein
MGSPFTLLRCARWNYLSILLPACTYFVNLAWQGISNPGGYVLGQRTGASVIAPRSAVPSAWPQQQSSLYRRVRALQAVLEGVVVGVV